MKQLLSALVLVAAVSLALPLVAFTDDIENDLDGSADSTLEVLSLLVTDAPRTVTFRARPRNGDGTEWLRPWHAGYAIGGER